MTLASIGLFGTLLGGLDEPPRYAVQGEIIRRAHVQHNLEVTCVDFALASWTNTSSTWSNRLPHFRPTHFGPQLVIVSRLVWRSGCKTFRCLTTLFILQAHAETWQNLNLLTILDPSILISSHLVFWLEPVTSSFYGWNLTSESDLLLTKIALIYVCFEQRSARSVRVDFHLCYVHACMYIYIYTQ